MTQDVKPPRNLRELVDQERSKLAADAVYLVATMSPTDPEYAISVGKYRGVSEFLDRIDEMVKRANKNDED